MGAPPVVVTSRAWAHRSGRWRGPRTLARARLSRNEPRAAHLVLRRGVSGPPPRIPTRHANRVRGRRSQPAGGVPAHARLLGQQVPQSRPEEAHRDLTRRTRVAGATQPNPGSPFRPGGGGKGRGRKGAGGIGGEARCHTHSRTPNLSRLRGDRKKATNRHQCVPHDDSKACKTPPVATTPAAVPAARRPRASTVQRRVKRLPKRKFSENSPEPQRHPVRACYTF